MPRLWEVEMTLEGMDKMPWGRLGYPSSQCPYREGYVTETRETEGLPASDTEAWERFFPSLKPCDRGGLSMNVVGSSTRLSFTYRVEKGCRKENDQFRLRRA